MAITNVQQKHANSSSSVSSVIVHPTSNVTAGNFLTAAVCLPAGLTVTSVVDLATPSQRWIQTAYSYGNATSTGGVELWTCRGAQSGPASVAVTFSAPGTVGVNVAEWAGVWWVDPLDQWSQTFGTSSQMTPQPTTPRTTGDLIITVGSVAASVSGPANGFTALGISGTFGYGVGYDILAGSVVPSTFWNLNASEPWTAIEACFVAGVAGVNPLLQFPETLVEVSQQQNYLAPLNGIGIWTNISQYVESMQLGPLGKQHELDRIQSTAATITVNNRTGVFNTWNTSSYLYPGGFDPMTPLKVTAAWSGVTYPVNYSYVQSVTPGIIDALNVTSTIATQDLLQMLSLKYLNSNNYAKLVESDGGANLQAFYRLSDAIGSFAVTDTAVTVTLDHSSPVTAARLRTSHPHPLR